MRITIFSFTLTLAIIIFSVFFFSDQATLSLIIQVKFWEIQKRNLVLAQVVIVSGKKQEHEQSKLIFCLFFYIQRFIDVISRAWNSTSKSNRQHFEIGF